MSISGAGFLLFLTAAALLYYLVPKAYRRFVLLAAGIIFYLSFSPAAGLCLLFTACFTFGSALLLGRLHRLEKSALDGGDADRKAVKACFRTRRKRLLAALLTVNFATLAVFKYLDPWLAELNDLFGFSFRPLNLLLPLGISFYIFQTSGYLIDCFRGRVEPERNFFKYALFVSYFPQMIQGPINRYQSLAPQLYEGSDFDADKIRLGIELLLWGMLKKVFLADPLADAVKEIYANYTAYSGFSVFLGAALYCIQLYADFSGGVDVVRGASQIFGIEMAENFKRPYFSRTLDEFWRRWHISLGEWMKDYLFYPMALSGAMGKLGKAARKRFGADFGKVAVPALCTLIVFLAVGVWQGPGLANIAYGLYNGLLMSFALLVDRRVRAFKTRLKIKDSSRAYRLFGVARTCFLVVIGRYFSRSASLYDALRMLWRTVRYFGEGLGEGNPFTAFGLDGGVWARVLFACAVLFAVSLLQEKGIRIRETLAKKPWYVQFVPLFIAVALLVVFVYLNTDYTAIAYVYESI